MVSLIIFSNVEVVYQFYLLILVMLLLQLFAFVSFFRKLRDIRSMLEEISQTEMQLQKLRGESAAQCKTCLFSAWLFLPVYCLIFPVLMDIFHLQKFRCWLQNSSTVSWWDQAGLQKKYTRKYSRPNFAIWEYFCEYFGWMFAECCGICYFLDSESIWEYESIWITLNSQIHADWIFADFQPNSIRVFLRVESNSNTLILSNTRGLNFGQFSAKFNSRVFESRE